MTKLSFEFFPPKTPQGQEKLKEAGRQLDQLSPAYYSVTYGAGGSTRDHTRDTVLSLKQEGKVVAPHLSFGVDDEDAVRALLQTYVDAGINRLVALRGDIPSGMGAHRLVYASELVGFVRQEFGEHFHIAVACYPEVHPQAKTYDEDVRYLKEKLAAGADYGVTQYFYSIEAFQYFMDVCAKQGIDKPIVPGIMPITNMDSLIRFSDACGAEIPRWIRKAVGDQANKEDAMKFGEDVVVRLCEQLIASGVTNLHFYTMNNAQPTLNICRRLGL